VPFREAGSRNERRTRINMMTSHATKVAAEVSIAFTFRLVVYLPLLFHIACRDYADEIMADQKSGLRNCSSRVYCNRLDYGHVCRNASDSSVHLGHSNSRLETKLVDSFGESTLESRQAGRGTGYSMRYCPLGGRLS